MRHTPLYIPPPVKPKGLLGFTYWEWAGILAVSSVVIGLGIAGCWVFDMLYHPWRYNS